MRITTVISVVSTKGGSGKTTTAANLGGLYAALGLKVLLIDADMQPSLTKYYPTQPLASGLNEVIARGGLIQDSDITPTLRENLYIVASNMDASVQAYLKDRGDSLLLLKRTVSQPIIRDQFDVVIIDTQGAKGELQRTAAMAADIMLSPLKPDMMNYSEFVTGTLDMLNSINVMADMVPSMKSAPLSIYVNCMERTVDAREIDNHVRDQFRTRPGVRLLDTKLPDSTVYKLARTAQVPVHEMEGTRRNGGPGAFELMHNLAHEILPHLKGLWVGGQAPAERITNDTSNGGAK